MVAAYRPAVGIGDSEANFFPNVKDGNFVALSFLHIVTLGSLVGRLIFNYSMLKVFSHSFPEMAAILCMMY